MKRQLVGSNNPAPYKKQCTETNLLSSNTHQSSNPFIDGWVTIAENIKYVVNSIRSYEFFQKPIATPIFNRTVDTKQVEIEKRVEIETLVEIGKQEEIEKLVENETLVEIEKQVEIEKLVEIFPNCHMPSEIWNKIFNLSLETLLVLRLTSKGLRNFISCPQILCSLLELRAMISFQAKSLLGDKSLLSPKGEFALKNTSLYVDTSFKELLNPSCPIHSASKNKLRLNLIIDSLEELQQFQQFLLNSSSAIDSYTNNIQKLSFDKLPLTVSSSEELNSVLSILSQKMILPNLTALTLGNMPENFIFKLSINLPGLVSLSIGHLYANSCLKLSHSFINLSHLSIQSIDNSASLKVDPYFFNLQSFTIGNQEDRYFEGKLNDLSRVSNQYTKTWPLLIHSFSTLSTLCIGDIPENLALQLPNFENLKTLSIHNIQFGASVVLPDFFDQLKRLTIKNICDEGDEGSIYLPKSLPNLKYLSIKKKSWQTIVNKLPPLLPKLQTLVINHLEKDLTNLHQLAPKLKNLIIETIRSYILINIEHPNIQNLRINEIGHSIADHTTVNLSNFDNLTSLSMGRLNNVTLEFPSTMDNLSDLSFGAIGSPNVIIKLPDQSKNLNFLTIDYITNEEVYTQLKSYCENKGIRFKCKFSNLN